MTPGSVSPHLSPYRVFNFTWTINNQAGDTVFSRSNVGTSPKWNPIIVDICKLALGAADSYWGTPDVFWPQTTAIETSGVASNGEGKCNNKARRAALRDQLYSQNGLPEGFYVCPGNHRDRSLNYKCQFENDFFCASWGCETTGEAYWKPSSSWDLITVKNNGTYSTDDSACDINQPSKGWCNPIIITFTKNAKNLIGLHHDPLIGDFVYIKMIMILASSSVSY